ncbi:secreted RxLR effector protein 161-like [Gastrolobium bilobum]|uniref:secreted RxLR effector protein 161-like n=1 Tax=Gastrolobium bilobum TaxID=150636 RepID=UPI002AB2CCE1|nr:secreted RxLR effector protein 161-like [Gastrolobium bilobum]
MEMDRPRINGSGSQRKYATDLLKRFHMMGCKTTATPKNTNEKLLLNDGTEEANVQQYRSLVGGLIYLTHTRPDISYSVGVISRFMHTPTKHHYGAAKRILRYVAGTRDFGIWYKQVKQCNLVGYTDSDWEGCMEDRRSTAGYAFYFGSGVISWSSKQQATVALSSSEAEFIAATATPCQGICLTRILEDLGQKQREETQIFCDNKATIAMTKNPVFHGRTILI